MNDEPESRADEAGVEAAPTVDLDATVSDGLTEPGEGLGTNTAETMLESVKQELAETSDRYLRLAADFDNFRKRTIRDRTELVANAHEGFVVELLPVVDNLERAVASVKGDSGASGEFEGITKGVELTLKMFLGVLGRHGVERMTVVGEEFDPHRHEALAQEETIDVIMDTVAAELEPGYTMRGKVVRPARVKVKKPKPMEMKEELNAVGDSQEEKN